jgi:hypothetical protein
MAVPGEYPPTSIEFRVTGEPKPPLYDKAVILEEIKMNGIYVYYQCAL